MKMSVAQGSPYVATPRPREVTPRFRQIVSVLQKWRNADHDETIWLHRNEVIELLNGIDALDGGAVL